MIYAILALIWFGGWLRFVAHESDNFIRAVLWPVVLGAAIAKWAAREVRVTP